MGLMTALRAVSQSMSQDGMADEPDLTRAAAMKASQCPKGAQRMCLHES